MLPDVSRESFARGTGIDNVSRVSLEKLTHYLMMLEKWQKAVNIVSPSTIPDAWHRHFLDSAQLGPILDLGEIMPARQRRAGASPVFMPVKPVLPIRLLCLILAAAGVFRV